MALRLMMTAVRNGLVNIRSREDALAYSILVGYAIAGCGQRSAALSELHRVVLDVGLMDLAEWKRSVRVVVAVVMEE